MMFILLLKFGGLGGPRRPPSIAGVR